MSELELSPREARRAQLVAQGLIGRRSKAALGRLLETVQGVQLDTISVLARSHELIAFARSGPLPRPAIEKAYWGGPPFKAFEYWYHAACILPMSEWPYFSFKRKAWSERKDGWGWSQLSEPEVTIATVIDQLKDRGPLTANELGGAKKGGPWWDWSEVKIAAEWLISTGELVCTSRRGFQRVYDLPERAIPEELLVVEVSDDEAVAHLVERALGALGVATAADLAAYLGTKRPAVERALSEREVPQAAVGGWKEPAFYDPRAIAVSAVSSRTPARPVMLSPFDSLVCDRKRLTRLFGFDHRLEAYVPRHKRLDGYYSMPVLGGDRLVARVDPARSGTTLVARSVRFEQSVPLRRSVPIVAGALLEAASWVRSDSVAVERVEPAGARGELLAAVVK